jgi:hypothetical protein
MSKLEEEKEEPEGVYEFFEDYSDSWRQLYTTEKKMPLIFCTSCKKKMAKEAKFCVKCGAYNPDVKFGRSQIPVLIGLIIVLLFSPPYLFWPLADSAPTFFNHLFGLLGITMWICVPPVTLILIRLIYKYLFGPTVSWILISVIVILIILNLDNIIAILLSIKFIQAVIPYIS